MTNYLAFPAIVDTPGQYGQMRKMWDGHHFKYHMDRMGKVKPMVDNKAPRTFIHCHMKMKKIQMEQERLMEVERDNRLLVSRIARTMAKGGLDNWNESYEVYSKNCSVSEDVRNRELVKISLENQAILNKINMTIPVYNHKQWLNDFKVTREYTKRLRKYPQTDTTKVPALNLIN
ncbi:sperm axonemal maintenance protein CFAP97D1-like [Clupea harengus]|uniref:Sperm axonemal maintenance protein CFAP97D1-like n=1 Tax=Clupea harengus TaxID=7950 RepID=A0A6P8FHG0_CLUHA|nr:sperm axonemal maintenance protein CFAP97D1-like [Clupea harengus]